jgi:hypothetical protein
MKEKTLLEKAKEDILSLTTEELKLTEAELNLCISVYCLGYTVRSWACKCEEKKY